MNRIKTIFTLIHILAWILFTLFLSWISSVSGLSYWFPLSHGILFTALYIFYSHFYLLTKYLHRRRYNSYLLGLFGIFLTVPIPFLLSSLATQNTWTIFSIYFESPILVLFFIFTFISWLARVIEDWFINSMTRSQLENQALQGELDFLKAQINPHFLFNTLNNVYTLTYKQDCSAPEAVLRLSSLMRYMIYESSAKLVLLASEIKYLEDYIGLQQLHYTHNPVVILEVEGNTASFKVAPLLFINLLENAYKHSPARLKAEDIKIKVEIKNSTLTFIIQNPIRNTQRNMQEELSGIGILNLRKRLQLLYPDQHKLDINISGEKFTATLKIYRLHTRIHERKTNLLYN